MELREIQISENPSGHQIIILGEKGGRRTFPIYIGFYEAYAMDIAGRGIHTPRPMTHDLIYNIIDGLELSMNRVLVDKLENDTFFGKLAIENGQGKEILIDSRPSDAIVLAAKRQLPIFVAEDVLNEVCREMSDDEEET